jgi:Ni,Fe-hydrogenase III large subunit
VLSVLGERVSGKQGAQYLEQAVAATENALTIFTPEAAAYQK